MKRLGRRLSRMFSSNNQSNGLNDDDGWEKYDPATFGTGNYLDSASVQEKSSEPHPHRKRLTKAPEWIQQSNISGWKSTPGLGERIEARTSASRLSNIPEQDIWTSPYGNGSFAHFDRSLPSHDRNSRGMVLEASSPYGAMMPETNAGLSRNWAASTPSFSDPYAPHRTTTESPAPTSRRPGLPETCFACTDAFSATRRAPGWISLACAHEPSICEDCIALAIKSSLDTRQWNNLTCPECGVTLEYGDIQRLADRETFARYEEISTRKAMEQDENFVWCLKCKSGQSHASGNSQPIVNCVACGFRFCFKHGEEWHERLTCDEYDEMQRDPDGFQSARDREAAELERAKELQDEADRRFAQELADHDRREEEERQRRRQAEATRIQQEEQEQRRRQYEEQQRRQYQEQQRRERARQEAEASRRRREAEERQRAINAEALRRRRREEEASRATIQRTTKRCPQCGRPIEKNAGCDHMTCNQCKKEFCWECLNDYNQIRQYGNSQHRTGCRYHSDNLPGS